MAPRPADGDAVGGETLLGDLDRVEAPSGDRRRDAAAFVERPGRAQPVGAVLGEPLRAGDPARFLVGGRGEEDVAAQARDRVVRGIEAGGTCLGREHPDDSQLHRDHGLHVDRAATVDVAVDEVGRERIVAPAVGRRGHDVEMREQEQRIAARAVAAQPGVDGAPAGDRFDDLGLEAGRLEQRREVARHPRLAVEGIGGRRIDRRDPDHRPEGLDELVDGLCPGRLGNLPRRRHGAEGHGALPNASASAMPMTKPPNISARTIQSSSLP